MKRKLRVAATVAVAVAVATVAVMLMRSAGSDRKTANADIFGHKVLEMLLCLPVTGCSAPESSPSFGTAAGAASSCAFRIKEAT